MVVNFFGPSQKICQKAFPPLITDDDLLAVLLYEAKLYKKLFSTDCTLSIIPALASSLKKEEA